MQGTALGLPLGGAPSVSMRLETGGGLIQPLQGRALRPGSIGGSGAQPTGSPQHFLIKYTGIFFGILCIFWIPM